MTFMILRDSLKKGGKWVKGQSYLRGNGVENVITS